LETAATAGTKGVWGMPWCQEAMKGVEGCDKLGEAVKQALIPTVMGLLPGSAQITGSVKFRGRELLGLNDRQMSQVRGKQVAMVFQDPMTSLDPVYKIGVQIAETVRQHDKSLSKNAARARAIDLLKLVGARTEAVGPGWNWLGQLSWIWPGPVCGRPWKPSRAAVCN
jgi:hypothetical protein